ncbi:MAG TPA: hypothetical protein VJ817_03050 [Gemmatimonadales bacterium]|nr:hypothetical protein [Gemmatimonadales bacterium]
MRPATAFAVPTPRALLGYEVGDRWRRLLPVFANAVLLGASF